MLNLVEGRKIGREELQRLRKRIEKAKPRIGSWRHW
jgi:hypothetical protein